MNKIRKIGLVVASVALAGTVAAQTNGSNSPYSRYGYGLLSDGGQGFNKGMSGLGYGMARGDELNFKNPASYARIDSLSFLFDVGLSVQVGKLTSNGSSTTAKNGSLDYLAAGFRLGRNLGMSLGLKPYSTIGYSMESTSTVTRPTGDITQTETYSGDGGLHEVYAGFGWRPVRPLAVGVNVGYLWGDMTNTILASFSSTAINSRRRVYTADVRTYKLDFGIQYEQPIDKKNSLTLGLTYGLGHDIGSKAYYYDQLIASSAVESADTQTVKNAFQLPHTFGVGVVWKHRNSWRVGVDYTFQKWEGLRYPTLNSDATYVVATDGYKNLHRIAAGFEYVPDPESFRWRQRVRYRFGVSYTTPYVKINGADGPKDYTVSLGVGLPITNVYNNRSVLNLSAQYERVEPKFSGMTAETYFRFTVGLSFNELWFMKWKVK